MARIYFSAAVIAVMVYRTFWDNHPFIAVAFADLSATLWVFLFSLMTNNSSMYDPYWSVAPLPICYLDTSIQNLVFIQKLVILLIAVWALRLTLNWIMWWRNIQT